MHTMWRWIEIEMSMQRFLHGLKFQIKGIVRHHQYNNMNELLHHAREAESQLAEEGQIKSRYSSSSRFYSRTPSAAPMESNGANNCASSAYSKPVSNVSMAKKPVAP